MTTVPALLGLSLAEAQGRLDAAHLQFTIDGSVGRGEVVVDQTPPAGDRVPLETTTVTLHFGKRA
jgi:beta-lactam-binding protein with PASTA domain